MATKAIEQGQKAKSVPKKEVKATKTVVSTCIAYARCDFSTSSAIAVLI